ncbi:MAG: hypothetical protein V2I40_09285 [Desulfobacteraceae bacterium]|jgi:hypothetical protein|nr:hypothetical protein [Desulfobacteraceae bacterium]
MVIISSLSFPPESAKEMAKIFLSPSLPKIPEFIARKGPYVNATVSDGVFMTALWELENAKLAEAMDFIGNYYATFFGVPGFKYEVKPFFHVEEALKMIGMG